MVAEKELGGWRFFVSSQEEFFPPAAIEAAGQVLSRWVKVFPREGTWIEREWTIPSLLVRLDCTFSDELHVYEVEERPAGVGIALEVNTDFQQRMKALLEIWPSFDVVVSPLRRGGDDHLWRRILTLPSALEGEGLVLVRAEPDEKEFHPLRARSVAPITLKGWKGYGLELGLWREINSPEELPWEEAFVLKPLQGSKMRDVEIWHPRLRKEVGGVSTRKRVEQTLSRCGKMFLQEFFPPMRRGELFVVYRVYFGYNPVEKAFVCLGGLWNGRPNQLRLHGASDAVFGPLVLGTPNSSF